MENDQVEQIDMKEALIREFQADPIYKMCLINGLKEDLFSPAILSMHPEASYGTVETGKILGRPDSTIRNHFRTDLIDYIVPERFGKYYRMNYICVFRLQMIFLLMEKCGKSTIDILVELGNEPGVSVSKHAVKKGIIRKSTGEVVQSEELDEKLLLFAKMIENKVNEQMLSTGLFDIEMAENGQKQIVLKEEYASYRIKLLQQNKEKESELERLNTIDSQVTKVEEQNEALLKRIEKIHEERKQDIAIKLAERRMELEVTAVIRAEALEKWAETNKPGLFAKLFKSEQIEVEKEKYISEYTKKHLNERLSKSMEEYHDILREKE